MKSLSLSIGLLLFAAGFAAADIIYPDGKVANTEPYQLRKIARGLNNVVAAPFEIPKAIFDVGYDEGVFSSQQLSVGGPRGVLKMFERVGSGSYDLFYWGDSDQNSLLHMEPEFLGVQDLIPGFNKQFSWETVDTPASPSTLR